MVSKMKTKIYILSGRVARVFICTILLLVAVSSAVYANTFVGPSTLTIDGTFTDWGTTDNATSGVYFMQDASNTGNDDGTGFDGKAGDLDYFWTAVSTTNGGTAPPSSTNLIQDYYYRVDLFTNKNIKQGYNIQLNLGTVPRGYADFMLQVFVDDSVTPQVKMILYQYDDVGGVEMRAQTGANMTAKVASISGYGVQDTNASGAIGDYTTGCAALEVNIPANWYAPVASGGYGGTVEADGSGASAVIGCVFSDTGSLGSVGTPKDTINDISGSWNASYTDIETGETNFYSDTITQIVFTTDPQTLDVSEVSGIMTIQTQDAVGGTQNVSADTTVSLTSTSGTGRFDTSAAGAFDGTITSVTITNGTNSASFYYKDTTAGVPTITAAESPAASPDWTDATQEESIGPTLESYKELEHTTVWGTVGDPYSGDTSTAYLYGANYFTSHSYHVAYYDSAGTKVQSEAITSGVDNTASSQYLLNNNPGAVAGTWHAVVFDDDLGSPPSTYVECSGAAGYIGEDSFEVTESAIPEIPSVIAGITVPGLCFGIYYWMRKRHRRIAAPVATR